MAQLARSMGTTASFGDSTAVKLEVEEDFLEEEHAPHTKRSRSSSSSSPLDQLSVVNNEFPIPPSQYNPLDEPSPLGLRLRKSPSLLDLIQMKLSQCDTSSTAAAPSQNLNSGSEKDTKATATATANATAGATDKLKASNFTASLLRIGSWEYVSKYEGDLVAKCYFAKHKLVWEILQSGLKSKIEIQWSDIMALKANCPEDGPGSLVVVLSRQPLFFRETNPQPRKHTLWQASGDFTDGQASRYRQHFLQCPPGILNKHYEKLIQCDVRLNFLSRQPEKSLDSPYFETQTSVAENPDEFKVHGLSQLGTLNGSMSAGFQDVASTSAASSSSLNSEHQNSIARSTECVSSAAPSPSSVMDTRAIEGNGNFEVNNFRGLKNLEQLKVPGLRPSISMSDLVNHIGNCITEQVTSGNLPSEKASDCQDMLENIAQILLSDTQCTTASDEKSLMKKVNSLCCLLQDPSIASSAQTQDGDNRLEGPSGATDLESNCSIDFTQEKNANNGNLASEQYPKDILAPSMSRKDSFGDFLLHLPRIASISNFLFDIAEDDERHGR